MGSPHKDENEVYVNNSTIFNTHQQLRLEIKIIQALKNFEIIYKRHFSKIDHHIFQEFSIKIINEKFEIVIIWQTVSFILIQELQHLVSD